MRRTRAAAARQADGDVHEVMHLLLMLGLSTSLILASHRLSFWAEFVTGMTSVLTKAWEKGESRVYVH